MTNIIRPTFNEQDIKILENISVEKINEQIEFLRTYKEVLWSNSEYPEPMTLSELRKKHSNIQSLPVYPEEFNDIGRYYSRLASKFDIKLDLHEEGFFITGSDATLSLGTLFSPSLIVVRVADAYYRDRFCDGLFGEGVEEKLYLKMLLHLLDCKIYYDKHKDINS